jgi:general secretion pathway protein K
MNPRGFALVIVLWSLVLLSLIVMHLVTSGRTETRIADNLVANAQAEEDANGAIWEAVFRLQDGPDSHWALDATPHLLRLQHAEALVRIVSEDGKINPNTAKLEVMTALLIECGAEAAQADALAQAILDWREPGETARPHGAKLAQYQAAGLDYAPPDAPFESVDELGRVLGMTPELLRRLKPHLSIYQQGEPDPTVADPVVADVLRRLNIRAAPPNAAQRPKTISVIAQVTTQNGGHFQRHALLRLGAALPNGYTLLAWDTEGG